MPKLNVIGKVPQSIGLTAQDFNNIFAVATAKLDRLQQFRGAIELRFVGETSMRNLNRDYAGNDYVTDVLSFDYSEGQIVNPGADFAAGAIVICTAQLRRQAKQYDVSPESEAALLFTHGLIHLSGFDHGSEAQQARFTELQDDIMKHSRYQGRNFTWSH